MIFFSGKHLFSFLFLLFFFHPAVKCQDTTRTVNSILSSHFLAGYLVEEGPKRKILSMKNKRFVAKLNPLNYMAAGMLFFYQRVVSEQIMATCTYEKSCSNFTREAMTKKGFLAGFLLGFSQLNCCFKGNVYDYPKYKISGNFKVANNVEDFY